MDLPKSVPIRSEASAASSRPADRPVSLLRLASVALVFRLVGLAAALVLIPGLLVPPDTQGLYLPVARSLASGGGYRNGGDARDAARAAPALPFWLAGVIKAEGGDPPIWVLGVFNAAFRAAAVVLVYRLALRRFGTRAGFWAACVYLLDPWESFWVGFVMKEPLAVPLFVLAVDALDRLDDRPSARRAWGAGLAIGMATLARFPDVGLWLASALMLMARAYRAARGGRRRALGEAVTAQAHLTLALAVTLAPWLWHTNRVIGRPVLSPHFAGQKFFTSNGPGVVTPRDGYYAPRGIDRGAIDLAGRGRSNWGKEGRLFSLTLRHVAEHPREFLARIAAKFVNMWQPTFRDGSVRNWLVLGLPYLVNMGLAVAGLIMAAVARRPAPATAAALLTFVCVHLFFWGEVRNRQYLTPLLDVYAGLALARAVAAAHGTRAVRIDAKRVNLRSDDGP